MKSSVADYRYKVHCLRIVPLWGSTVYLTDHPHDLEMGGNTYATDSGYEFTGSSEQANMSPGVLDLSGIAGVAGISIDEISSGVFDNAKVYAFATTWNSPVEDEEPIGLAYCGKTTVLDDRYTIELMMMPDVLNQSVGKTYSPACQKEFAAGGTFGCSVSPGTFTGTITSVTSSTVLVDSSRAEAADYFGVGTIEMTSGANVGLKPMEIKTFAAGGTFTLYEPFHYTVEVGDTYTAIPGCRKRKDLDCIAKWNNITEFGGFSFIPTQSVYSQVGNR